MAPYRINSSTIPVSVATLSNFLISFHFSSLQTSKSKSFRMYLTSRGKTKVTMMEMVFVLTKTRNEPKCKKPDKTRCSQPKPVEMTSKNCETTWSTKNFKIWGNLELSASFPFSNFGPKCPNLGILGEKESTS